MLDIGAAKPAVFALSEPVFDRVYRELFPQDDAAPTVRQVMEKDFAAGLGVMESFRILDLTATRLQTCGLLTVSATLHAYPKAKKALADEGWQPLLEQMATGVLDADCRWADRLFARKEEGRCERNRLEAMKGWTPDNGIWQECQRPIGMAVRLQEIVEAVTWKGDDPVGKVGGLQASTLKLVAACVSPYRARVPAQGFAGSEAFAPSPPLATGVRRRFARAFLAIYGAGQGTMH